MKLPKLLVSAWVPAYSEELNIPEIMEAYTRPSKSHRKVLRLVAESGGMLQIRTNDPAWADNVVQRVFVEYCTNANIPVLTLVPVLDKSDAKVEKIVEVARAYRTVCGAIGGESVLSKKTGTLYKGAQAQERIDQFARLCQTLRSVNPSNRWYLKGTDLAQSMKAKYKGFDPLTEWQRWRDTFGRAALQPIGVLQALSDDRVGEAEDEGLSPTTIIAEAAAWCRGQGLEFGVNPINDNLGVSHRSNLSYSIGDIWSQIKSPVTLGLTTWDRDIEPEEYWGNVLACVDTVRSL